MPKEDVQGLCIECHRPLSKLGAVTMKWEIFAPSGRSESVHTIRICPECFIPVGKQMLLSVGMTDEETAEILDTNP